MTVASSRIRITAAVAASVGVRMMSRCVERTRPLRPRVRSIGQAQGWAAAGGVVGYSAVDARGPSTPDAALVLADADLRLRLIEDTHHGWRTFVDQHTTTLLALIERAGIRDRDEAMEIYTLACERLAANECAR